MPRITGKNGEIYVPVGKGNAASNTALTLSTSKTINGTAYANRFYGTSSRTAWNKTENPTVRIQGVIGDVSITPGTANDTVVVGAFTYYHDNGAAHTSTAATLTLTRSTAAAQWHMIHCSLASGTCAITAGSITTVLTAAVETFAADGGPAYVATTELLLGAVKLNPEGSAVITSDEIIIALSDGTLIQERSDIPGYHIVPLEGGVLLNSALLACHTGAVRRGVYASYTDQYPLLAKLGDIEGWSLSATADTATMEAAEDMAPEVALLGAPKTSGTLNRFYVKDATLYANAMQRQSAILKLRPDSTDSAVYFEAAVIMKSWGIDVSVGNAVKENAAFDCDGPVEQRGV